MIGASVQFPLTSLVCVIWAQLMLFSIMVNGV